MGKPNSTRNNPDGTEYRPPNNHVLSTGLNAVPQGRPDQSYKTGGRSSGQDVSRQALGSDNLSTNYDSTTSRGEAKGTRPEVAGGVPRGFVHQEAAFQPTTQDVGSLRPDGSKRVIFGGNPFDGYGDPNGGAKPDPTTIVGGASSTGPGGAGV